VVDTKPRLREPREEVRASYNQACGHVLFSSDDRKTAWELITPVVSAREFINDNAVGISDSDGVQVIGVLRATGLEPATSSLGSLS
jgi:hypothetical protein